MTTSEPQAGRRDDDLREHRSIGQRIREAVLGDDEPRRDATGHDDPAAYDDPATRGDTGASVRDDTVRDDSLRDEVRDSGLHGDTVRDDSLRDEVRDSGLHGDTVRDGDVRGDTVRGDSDREYAGYEQAMREHVEGGAVPDPVRDDVAQDGTRRDVTDGTGSGYGGTTGGVGDNRDAVTSSYDPDRDSDYDPHAAGTALSDPPARGAAGAGDQYDNRGYQPATDTGYVGESHTDADRVPDRDVVDRDRDTGRGAGGAAAGAAAGAAVASATHHGDDRRAERTGFSEVDDTSAVEPDTARRGTTDGSAATSGASAGAVSDRSAGSTSSEGTDAEGRERLVPAARAEEYSARWDALKGDFVDEPQRAVTQADQLVGELLDEIQRVFTDQRRELDKGFDHDRASTEDLRLALRRYRSFFDRLLSF